jgi:sugar O-acyltransferase (sialic acid O-acetyltransferase NeuD family)
MQDIILVGAGGHCRACIDVVEQTELYRIIGIVDKPELLGTHVLGYEVKWCDEEFPALIKMNTNFLITVGQIRSASTRLAIFEKIKHAGGNLPVIISPLAYVSKYAKIAEGTIVMHQALVNARASIGKCNIVNSKALIEHDTIIGDNSHISTGARINGNCEIGENCFIGSGSIVNHGVEVISDVIIGSGSLIRKDIVKSGMYSGNPLKQYK